MVAAILGARIRQHRSEMGMTQAELARRVEISASYLNLIEWNKRPVAAPLLRKIAEALELTLDDLSIEAEQRLHQILAEIAHLPSLAEFGVEDERIGELIGRFPGWARAMGALARSEREATARAHTLSDRLSNDPFLSETVHRMLTRIASIRSAADILTEYPDTPAPQRERFNRIVHEESRALSDIGEALASYLDKAEEEDRVLTPIDEVEAFFDAHDGRFESIDAAAETLTHLLTDPRPISRRDRARALAQEQLARLIDDFVDREPRIKTSAAHDRARRALMTYAIGAIRMPMANFSTRASELRYDVEALADAFSAEIEAVCQRLTALPRTEGIPRFGYFRANAAGTIIEMHSLRGLAVPRYAAACPLWVLYRAQQSPETFIRQRTVFPTGERFVFVGRARIAGPSGFGKPRHYLTDMIAMRDEDARYTVYAPETTTLVEEVGPSCRLCPRLTCHHRVEDPLTDY